MKNILLQIFFACSFYLASGQGVTAIDIPGLLKTERDPALSEIAQSIQFVKLETTPECLIGAVRSVARWGDNFLITARETKSLLIFSKAGKFVKSFGTTGKGPGEFMEIYGMAFDSKTSHLYILDNGQVKVLEYDETGRFLKEFKLGFYATGVKVIDNGFVFYTGSVYNYKTDGYLLTVTDRNGKIKDLYHQRSFLKGLPDHVAAKYSDGGEWCYWESYWDTVYSFNGSSYHPRYYFNIGKNRIPQNLLETNSNMSGTEFDSYMWITNFTEFRNFLYIGFIDRNRIGKKLYYDKVIKTGYCIPQNKIYYNWGFINDFCGGPLFTIGIKISMNEAACAYQVTDLKEDLAKGRIDPKNAKDTALYQAFTKMINESSADDNPILVIAHLK